MILSAKVGLAPNTCDNHYTLSFARTFYGCYRIKDTSVDRFTGRVCKKTLVLKIKSFSTVLCLMFQCYIWPQSLEPKAIRSYKASQNQLSTVYLSTELRKLFLRGTSSEAVPSVPIACQVSVIRIPYYRALSALLDHFLQLSNIWWIPNSVTKGFDTAMRTGSSRWFNWNSTQPICDCHVDFP